MRKLFLKFKEQQLEKTREVRFEGLPCLHTSPCVIRVTKSVIKRWAGLIRGITAARN